MVVVVVVSEWEVCEWERRIIELFWAIVRFSRRRDVVFTFFFSLLFRVWQGWHDKHSSLQHCHWHFLAFPHFLLAETCTCWMTAAGSQGEKSRVCVCHGTRDEMAGVVYCTPKNWKWIIRSATEAKVTSINYLLKRTTLVVCDSLVDIIVVVSLGRINNQKTK